MAVAMAAMVSKPESATGKAQAQTIPHFNAPRIQDQPSLPRAALAGQAWEHHQINVAALGMAPLAKFSRQGPLLGRQRLGLEILKALVHQIKGLINHLGRLLGGHGSAREGCSVCSQIQPRGL